MTERGKSDKRKRDIWGGEELKNTDSFTANNLLGEEMEKVSKNSGKKRRN